VAIVSFVCSVGNVPLAAVLWRGGISFGGVISFIFADLIVLPVLDIYRRYYGGRVALYILGTFYVTMVLAGYIVELLFGALGIIPTDRTVGAIAEGPAWNYTTVLNIVFFMVAVALVVRFLRTGGPDMLRMMNMPEDAMHDGNGAHQGHAGHGMEHEALQHHDMMEHATPGFQGSAPVASAEMEHAAHQHGQKDDPSGHPIELFQPPRDGAKTGTR
jgi:uncharacterized membrane protein YraQ (UPF0718 family)